MDRDEALKLLADDILVQLKAQAAEVGQDLADTGEALAVYTAERLDHLALIAGEAGFEEAVVAERDNVALKATTDAVTEADAIDARVMAVLRGGLALAARGVRILAGVPPVA